MYRIEAKIGRKWKLGIVVYETFEDVNKRKKEMEAVGCKVRIAKTEY